MYKLRMSLPFYLVKMKEDFDKKRNRNPNFSLRSYARKLEIQPPTLSGILNGKRGIPKRYIKPIVDQLRLSPKETQLFINSLTSISLPDSSVIAEERLLTEDANFKIVSEWEHNAILSIIELPNFEPNIDWISKRLGISKLRVEVCLSNLQQASLIKWEDGEIEPCQNGTRTTEDIPSTALRKAREEDLRLAQKKLDEVDVLLRDFSSITFTLSLSSLPEIKEKIRSFRKSLCRESEVLPGDEVYKLSVQLFPLSQKIKKEKK